MTLKVEQDEFVGDWVVYSDVGKDGSEHHVIKRFDDFNAATEYAIANEMRGTKFEKLEQLIEAVNTEVHNLSDTYPDEVDEASGLITLPHEIRWKLHVAACSMEDYTFWCYKAEEGNEWYRVFEVETGVWAEGSSPRHALENYFSGSFPDVLSLPHVGDSEEDD